MQGYLAGGQCFGSVQEASNYKGSMIAPVITADGNLQVPVFQNGSWYYGSQQIIFTHAPCDPVAYVKDGMQTAAIILAVAVFTYVIREIIRIFRKTEEAI